MVIDFSPDFFREEVRDGFYIDGQMKSCWAAQLMVFWEIHKICEKYNLQYFAEYGTLLGAVRHRGYIPWDDDFDICMRREDFERFIEVAPKELPGFFKILSFRDQNTFYWEFLIKVVNTEEIRTDEAFLDVFKGCPFVVGVDIFCLDYLPRNKMVADKIRDLAICGQEIVESIDPDNISRFNQKEFDNKLKEFESKTGNKVDRKGNIKQQIRLITDGFFSSTKEEDADYLTLMYLWVSTEGRYKIPKEQYGRAIYMPFENIKLPVPVGFEAILRLKYNNYMRIVQGSAGHNYPTYGTQIRLLKERTGRSPYEYIFSKKDMEKNNEKNENSVADQISESLSLFPEAHSAIKEMLAGADFEAAKDLIASCQEMAISVGTMIDEETENGSDSVSVLEVYCEQVFACYNLVDSNLSGVSELCEEMEKNIRYVIETTKDLIFKEKVLFLLCHSDQWSSIYPLWKKEKENPKIKVTTVVFPFYYKNHKGEPVQVQFDIDKYPQEVEVISVTELNLENLYYNRIYFEEGHDGLCFGMDTDAFFYSDNLKKYTDSLIYVSPYDTNDLFINTNCSDYSMSHYVTIPGFINSDVVYVQSEIKREAFIEKLTAFAGNDTRNVWEEKIRVDDCDNHKKALVEKKKLMFYISIGELWENGKNCISKIQNALNCFESNKDKIDVVWIDEESEGTENIIDSDIWAEYSKLKSSSLNKDWIITVPNYDVDKYFSECDAYYGSNGYAANEMRFYGKPVMI